MDEAVRAAREAFPAWRSTPPVVRARACFEFKYRLEEALDELALLVTTDNGKALKDAAGEVRRGIECVEVATGIPTSCRARTRGCLARHRLRHDPPADRRLRRRHPVQLPVHGAHVVPAVRHRLREHVHLQAVEQDPLASQRTFELLEDIVPPGVVNLVHGGKAGRRRDPRASGIDGVSFVGSTPVAHYIYETAAKHGKRVQALGAKNHVIVMPDAELDAAVDGVLSSAFHAAGQRCLANSVCIGVGDAYEPLKTALAEKCNAMVVGNGADPETEVGPVISSASQERILGWIEKGASEPRARRPRPRLEDGNCRPDDHRVRAGLGDRPGGDLRPVLTLLKAADLGEALEILNSSTKGTPPRSSRRAAGP